MRRFVIVSGVIMALGGVTASGAGAASNPAGSGQPGVAQLGSGGVSCPDTITTPNGFNSPGFAGTASGVYANGNKPSTTMGTPGGTHAISEYDIACYQTTQSHP